MNDTEKAAHADDLDQKAAKHEAAAKQLRFQAAKVRDSITAPGKAKKPKPAKPADGAFELGKWTQHTICSAPKKKQRKK